MQLSNKFCRGDKIVIASHNEGKIMNLKHFLQITTQIITSNDIGIKDVKETGKSFQENSLIKVKSIPEKYIAISDDSGLSVTSLGGGQEYTHQDFKKIVVDGSKQWKGYIQMLTKKNKDFSAKFTCCLSIKFSKNLIYSYLVKLKENSMAT